jgi:hypothetical protein
MKTKSNILNELQQARQQHGREVEQTKEIQYDEAGKRITVSYDSNLKETTIVETDGRETKTFERMTIHEKERLDALYDKTQYYSELDTEQPADAIDHNGMLDRFIENITRNDESRDATVDHRIDEIDRSDSEDLER